MPSSYSIATSVIRAAAGEPLDYHLQLASSTGVVESLAGRAFVWAWWKKVGDKRVDAGVYAGRIERDETGDFIVWGVDGTVTELLVGQGTIYWEWSERLDNGRDRLATGTLVIDDSAPEIEDNDAAPRARWVTKLVRKSDPDTIITPKWVMSIVRYGGGGSTAPSNNGLPIISGNAQVGQSLAVSNGSWTNSPTTFTHQWRANGVNIAGATAATYTVTTTELGKTLTATVTAANKDGVGVATSAATAAVQPRPVAPVNSTLPTISGVARVGLTLTANDGVWTGSPTLTRVWKRNGVVIVGATGTSFTLTAADVGTTITVTVSATNAGGVTNATSAATSAVIAKLPVFTVQPTISSDGSPMVGEIALLVYGEVEDGYVTGARLLRIDNSTVALADAGMGSYQWVFAGTFALEVTATGPGGTVKATSAPITVSPGAATILAKPTLTRTAGTTAGTNPPEMTVSWGQGGIDRNLDLIQYQYTQSATYSGNITDYALSDGVNFIEEFTVVTGSDLAAGTFKARARIKRLNANSTYDYSDWSDEVVETLNAASLPPATTTWGKTAALVYGALSNPTLSTDNRTVRLGESKAAACGTSVKGRKAYAELNISMEGGATDYLGNIGVVDERQLPMRNFNNNPDNYGQTQHTGWVSPSGGVGYNGPRQPSTVIKYGHGDKIGVLIDPIVVGGVQTGSKITFYKNSVLYCAFDTDIIEARVTAYATAYANITLNAGQEAFATSGMAAFQWG